VPGNSSNAQALLHNGSIQTKASSGIPRQSVGLPNLLHRRKSKPNKKKKKSEIGGIECTYHAQADPSSQARNLQEAAAERGGQGSGGAEGRGAAAPRRAARWSGGGERERETGLLVSGVGRSRWGPNTTAGGLGRDDLSTDYSTCGVESECSCAPSISSVP
jgi:hypothetical protein